ncbi:hypothetical protein [Paeniglutamicibacter sp.]|uniref:hypothetical protein n=1 Tax=Paeniglutamicibacter sp. TaxID=1934391 RepID=UPI003988E2DE
MAEQAEFTEAHQAWVLVLDGLAEHVAGLRGCAFDDSALLELSTVPWQPPVGIGDLPAALAPRAAALVEELEELRPALLKRRDETVRQLRAVVAVPRDSTVTSVYLDSVG